VARTRGAKGEEPLTPLKVARVVTVWAGAPAGIAAQSRKAIQRIGSLKI
jgi:hypothetical protein